MAQLGASGRMVLSVFNDRTIIAAQMRMGKQEADARLYLNGRLPGGSACGYGGQFTRNVAISVPAGILR